MTGSRESHGAATVLWTRAHPCFEDVSARTYDVVEVTVSSAGLSGGLRAAVPGPGELVLLLNVGVIGCGQWGKNYVRVLNELPAARVVRVADPLQPNRAFVEERYPAIDVCSDHRDVMGDPEIQAVVIATPAASHFDLAMEGLDSGKHVIVEKPMALHPEHCERVTKLAARRKRVLMVGHTFLYNASVRKVKEIVDDDRSGAIYYLTARRNHLGKVREDVSVLWDLAAHDVSIFCYLLEQAPVSISAVGGCYLRADREDVIFMTLRFPDGALGHIQASWMEANKTREIILIAGKRRIVFDDLNNLESVRVFEKGISIEKNVESFGEFQYRLRDGEILSPKVERREPLKTMCQDFLDCVSEGRTPLSDGAVGTLVVQVLQAAEDSLAHRGAEVRL